MKEILKKFISRRIALGVSGVSTVVTAALKDGIITEQEFFGIVATVIAAIAFFTVVDYKEKEKQND